MSNNDDFDFNRDDLFDDFDDDDSGSDDFGADDFASDDFDFGDDSDDFNLDDDEFGSELDSALGGDDDDFGGGDDDDFATAESGQAGGGTSRTFIIIAAVMGFILIAGLGLVLFLALQPDEGAIAFEATKAAIETQNAISFTQIAASETAAIDNATATEAANIANATATEQAIIDATASYVPPSPTPTEDLTATAVEATNQVIAAQETSNAQFSIDATNTEIAFQLTLNPATATPEGGVPTEEGGTEPQGGTPVSLPAVQQTATALAQLFAASPTPAGGGEVQPTDITGGGTTDGGTGGAATQEPGTSTSGQGGGGNLPDTGLFDEVFQGNPSLIFLAAFGLLGVIVFSRSVRGRKRHD